jgi:hypothetical protein
VAGQRQREGQLLDGERAGDAGLGQCRDDVRVDVEVAEQGRVLGDRRAAELLGGLLELLGLGGAGLGVLDVGGGGGVLDGGQCSRLGLKGDRCLRCPPLGASRVGCRGTRSSADVGLQTGCSVNDPGDGPCSRAQGLKEGPRASSGRLSAHYDKRTEGLADSHSTVCTA